MAYDELLVFPPYGVEKEQKQEILLTRMRELTSCHCRHCEEYRRIAGVIPLKGGAVDEQETFGRRKKGRKKGSHSL